MRSRYANVQPPTDINTTDAPAVEPNHLQKHRLGTVPNAPATRSNTHPKTGNRSRNRRRSPNSSPGHQTLVSSTKVTTKPYIP